MEAEPAWQPVQEPRGGPPVAAEGPQVSEEPEGGVVERRRAQAEPGGPRAAPRPGPQDAEGAPQAEPSAEGPQVSEEPVVVGAARPPARAAEAGRRAAAAPGPAELPPGGLAQPSRAYRRSRRIYSPWETTCGNLGM